MKQFVFSNKYELHQMMGLLRQGAVIRGLTQDDVARVGDIVGLTAVGSKDEDDLVLEVAPAEDATDTETSSSSSSSDEGDEEGDGKDCYW